MRKLFGLTLALFAFPMLAAAQTGPAIEVRLRSVNDLLDKVEYLGGIANQPEPAKQAAAFVKALTDEKKGIEGIDPARPTGLYASITKDVVDSPVVLMIPLADEEAFLGLLTGKLGLEPKKGDDGVYKLDVPNIPAPVYFRFANKYVYATVQTVGSIDAKKLLDPKAFFATTDSAVLSAKVYFDRLPAEVKKTVLAQYELKVNDAKERKEPNESDAQRKLRQWALDQSTAVMQQIFDGAEVVTLRLLVEPKSDDLTLEAFVKAKQSTTLYTVFDRLEGRVGPATWLEPKAAMLSAAAKLGLRDDARKSLAPVIDELVKEAIANAKESDRGPTKLIFDAILPTLKAGELETSFYATEANADGKIGGMLTLKVAEGLGIEKTLKQFAPFIPESAAKFEFDVKKVEGVSLHKLTAPGLKEVFTSDTLWLGTSDTMVMASVESDGKAITKLAKDVAHAAGAAPVTRVEVSVAGMIRATEKGLKPDEIAAAIKEAFGSEGVKDTFRFSVEPADLQAVNGTLTVRASLKGRAVKLLVLIDEAKKK